MTEFCEAFSDHNIIFLVDNATAHTSKVVNLNDIRLNIGGQCQLDKIEWKDENNNLNIIELFFTTGENKGKSKGLKVIATELGFKFDSKIKLDDLRSLVKDHPAFKPETNLENLF
jgi:hypothetical protein